MATTNFEKFPEALKEFYGGQNADGWRISFYHLVILHEFGHVLGLSHEHFNPQCQKDLDMDKIIKAYAGSPNYWPEDLTRLNMDAKFYAENLTRAAGDASALFNSATTDQKSVMLYVMRTEFFKSGDKSVCKAIGDHKQPWSTTLSEGDKQFYLANYGVGHSPLGPEAAPALQ